MCDYFDAIVARPHSLATSVVTNERVPYNVYFT